MAKKEQEKNDFSLLRKEFPLLKKKAYFASCSKGLLSYAVKAGMESFITEWETLGAPFESHWVGRTEQARAKFAELIGADTDEVAVFSSVSVALASFASAFYRDMLGEFNNRNTILIDRSTFPTDSHVWMVRRPLGIHVSLLPLIHNEVTAEVYSKHLDKKTLGVLLNHVNYTSGALCDVDTILQMAHDNGSFVIIDDSQSLGTMPIDVHKSGVDVLVSAATKYLCSPLGIAFMYIRKDLIKRLKPTSSGWFGHRHLYTHLEPIGNEVYMHPDDRIWTTLDFMYANNARRFEQGTPEVIGAAGSVPALQLLIDLGLDAIANHIAMLTSVFIEEATNLGASFKTPLDPERRGPMVVVKTLKNEKLAEDLEKANVSTAPRGKDGLRFSFHFYNNEKDVSKAIDALSKLKHLL